MAGGGSSDVEFAAFYRFHEHAPFVGRILQCILAGVLGVADADRLGRDGDRHAIKDTASAACLGCLEVCILEHGKELLVSRHNAD